MLGVPWLRPDTVVISTGGQLILTFDDKTQVDLERILMALSSNGYAPSDVKTLSH